MTFQLNQLSAEIRKKNTLHFELSKRIMAPVTSINLTKLLLGHAEVSITFWTAILYLVLLQTKPASCPCSSETTSSYTRFADDFIMHSETVIFDYI